MGILLGSMKLAKDRQLFESIRESSSSYKKHPHVFTHNISPVRIRGKGRGIVAHSQISSGEIIERAPAIVWLDLGEDHSVVDQYVYDFGEDSRGNSYIGIGLGLTSLYNHATWPNAFFRSNRRDKTVEIVTSKPIQLGEEVTLNYLGEDGETGVWFDEA